MSIFLIGQKYRTQDDALFDVQALKQRRYLDLEKKILLFSLKSAPSCGLVRFINLSHNDMRHRPLDFLVFMPLLIKVDLSYCNITSLPKAQVFAGMKDLKIVYLHHNLIAEPKEIEKFHSNSQLTYLTIFDNPIASIPGIRYQISQKLWSLKALDFHIITDMERLGKPPTSEEEEKHALTAKTKLRWPTYSESNFSLTEPQIINAIRVEELGNINYLFEINSPVVKIQRVYRGHFVRKKNQLVNLFLMKQEKKNLQDQLVDMCRRWRKKAHQLAFIRKVLNERGKGDYALTVSQLKKRNANQRVVEFVQKLKKKAHDRRIYEKVRNTMLTSYNKMYAVHKAPDLFFDIMKYKRVFFHARQFELFKETLKTVAAVSWYALGVLTSEDIPQLIERHTRLLAGWRVFRANQKKKDMTVMPIVQLIRMNFDLIARRKEVDTFDSVQQKIRAIPIKRKTRCVLNNKQRKRVQIASQRIENMYKRHEEALYVVELPDTLLLYILIKQILAQNRMVSRKTEPLNLYFDVGLRRVSAATCIQAWYRRIRAMRRSPYKNIVSLIYQNRAATTIQRWIRNFKFRYRMAFLDNLNVYLNLITTEALYIEEEIYTQLQGIIEKLPASGLTLVDQAVAIFVNPKKNVFVAYKYNKALRLNLTVMPRWFKAGQMPIHSSDVEDFELSDVTNLIHLGTVIKRKIKCQCKYYKVQFRNIDEARQVAALMAYQTFKYKRRGCFLRFIQPNYFRGKGERFLQLYHTEVAQVYGIRIPKNFSREEIDRFLCLNNSGYQHKRVMNSGLIVSKTESDIIQAARTICPDNLHQVRVRDKVRISSQQNSSAKKRPEKVLETEDFIYFIPLNKFERFNEKTLQLSQQQLLDEDRFGILRTLSHEDRLNRSFHRARDRGKSNFSPSSPTRRKSLSNIDEKRMIYTRSRIIREMHEDEKTAKHERYLQVKHERAILQAKKEAFIEEEESRNRQIAQQLRKIKELKQSEYQKEMHYTLMAKKEQAKAEKEQNFKLQTQAVATSLLTNQVKAETIKRDQERKKSWTDHYNPLIRKIHQRTNQIIRSEFRGMLKRMQDDQREELAAVVRQRKAEAQERKTRLNKSFGSVSAGPSHTESAKPLNTDATRNLITPENSENVKLMDVSLDIGGRSLPRTTPVDQITERVTDRKSNLGTNRPTNRSKQAASMQKVDSKNAAISILETQMGYFRPEPPKMSQRDRSFGIDESREYSLLKENDLSIEEFMNNSRTAKNQNSANVSFSGGRGVNLFPRSQKSSSVKPGLQDQYLVLPNISSREESRRSSQKGSRMSSRETPKGKIF